MKIPEDELRRIKSAVNLIEVVGEHVVLKKAGSNYTGLCPFHNERSPSFSVSERKQLYHCYGCKAGGDVLSFVMEINGLSFSEAVEDLCERAGIPTPKGINVSSEQTQARRLALKLNRFAAHYFREELGKTAEASEYLKKRGVNDEIQNLFYVGYARSEWEGLARFLKKAKAPLDEARRLGLIRPSQKAGKGDFDLFRDRVMFPILNSKGNVIAFGGRTLGNDPQAPKYLNSPDSSLYQKSQALFGLFQAKKFIRERAEVVVVEGFFDVTAMHQYGFGQTVATCGTALTAEHLKRLGRLSQRVVLLFDADRAGKDASDRAMEVGLQAGVLLYSAEIPSGKDPAEFFDGGNQLERREEMKGILKRARPLLDQRIHEVLQQVRPQEPETQAQAVKTVARWLSLFKDQVGREIRAKLVTDRLGIDPRTLAGAMGSQRGRQTAAESVRTPLAERVRVGESGLPRNDRVLLAHVFQSKEGWESLQNVANRLPVGMTPGDLFEHLAAKKVIQRLHERMGERPEFLEELKSQPSAFLGASQENQAVAPVLDAIREALLTPTPVFTDPEIRTAEERALSRSWARFSHDLKQRLAAAEASQDTPKHQVLLKEYLDVQRKLKELESFYGKTKNV